ncbi:hypothetical protein BC834DRAFT_571988 [Gloeopeniophorella convolvens]|nr:hypothetical protein BC834DRAFT_571988 [Gloeopeniophorella convolvens]
MPKELPGLYFDAEKNRYFPSSSRPAGHAQTSAGQPPQKRQNGRAPRQRTHEAESSSSEVPLQDRRQGSAWRTLQASHLASRPKTRVDAIHQMMTAQIESTASCLAVPIHVDEGDTLTAFGAGVHDDQVWSVAGDSTGYIYISEHSSTGRYLSAPPYELEHSWAQVYLLDSRVSSVCSSGSRCVATSFGSTVLTSDMAEPWQQVQLSPPPRLVHDIWTSRLRDRSLVLGVAKRAVYIADIDNALDLRSLDTQSDVFALHQEENLVYAGARNGSVTRFDTRERASVGTALLDGAFARAHNSVTYLRVVREWQLLASTIRGNIEIFDVRAVRGTRPLMALAGHVNAYQPSLMMRPLQPHAVTPSEDYLFAAGLDHHIRGWSLRTGEPLSSAAAAPDPAADAAVVVPGHYPRAVSCALSPLAVKFEEQITALEAVQIDRETCLFATAGNGVHKFALGRRAGQDVMDLGS